MDNDDGDDLDAARGIGLGIMGALLFWSVIALIWIIIK